jgi:hypothetical protein
LRRDQGNKDKSDKRRRWVKRYEEGRGDFDGFEFQNPSPDTTIVIFFDLNIRSCV